MSKGHVFLAQNSNVNYVRQACALALSIKKFNKIHNKTCLITNDVVPNEYSHAFDHIVPIPWSDLAVGSSWKVENRWKIIHATPFKENIVYDTDMILLNTNDHWWDYFVDKDLYLTSNVRDYRGNIITNDFYRKTFTYNQLPNAYVGCFYFKKTQPAFEFFKWLDVISQNWESFYSKFLKTQPQRFLSIDVTAALALKFSGLEETAIVKQSSIPSFTHMKPAIQSWPQIPEKWTNTVPSYFSKHCELTVGGYKQQGLFHYVEDEFLQDYMLFNLTKHE